MLPKVIAWLPVSATLLFAQGPMSSFFSGVRQLAVEPGESKVNLTS